jgi:hypothetical protein
VLALRSRAVTPLALVLCASSVALLLAACGDSHAAPPTTTTASLPPIGAPPQATGPPTARALAVVRRAAAHTLTQKVVASLEYTNPMPSVGSATVGASGSFDLGQATGEEAVHDPTGEETIVFLPTKLFVLPARSEVVGLPRGKSWVRVDVNERLPGRSAAALAEFILRIESRDLGFLLGEVASGATTAAPLGRRVIGGTSATGYLVHVDLARAAAAAAAGPRAKWFLRTAKLAERATGGRAAQKVWVWVDGSNRIVALRASTPGSGIKTALMTITSFGRLPVHPVPPDATKVVDLATLTPAGDNDGD